MVFRITPSLGPDLDQVGPFYFDSGQPGASYELGTIVMGSDGHPYIFVQASAAIAATPTTGTQVTITEPAFTAATGAGGFWTPPGVAIASGVRFHARKAAAV
jgi:hypothetical protein